MSVDDHCPPSRHPTIIWHKYKLWVVNKARERRQFCLPPFPNNWYSLNLAPSSNLSLCLICCPGCILVYNNINQQTLGACTCVLTLVVGLRAVSLDIIRFLQFQVDIHNIYKRLLLQPITLEESTLRHHCKEAFKIFSTRNCTLTNSWAKLKFSSWSMSCGTLAYNDNEYLVFTDGSI